MSKYTVVRQAWREYERGWGSRHDGYSLHLTIEDCDAFFKEYSKKHHTTTYAPDTYSTVDGSPMPFTVDQIDYDLIAASTNGIWETHTMVENRKTRT